MIKHLAPLQREMNAFRSLMVRIPIEVSETLDPKTGKATYKDMAGVVNCIQAVDTLSFWRRLLAPILGKNIVINGVKYLHLGQYQTKEVNMDKQKLVEILSEAIKWYGKDLWAKSPVHKDFSIDFNSGDCAKRCADALFPDFVSDPHTMIKTPHGDLKLFDPPNLPDNLAGIKSALGLPDDTPEPLVGVIWGLQQRIEDLEEEGKKKARYVASIVVEGREIEIDESGARIFQVSGKSYTFPSVESAKKALEHLRTTATANITYPTRIRDAHTGKVVWNGVLDVSDIKSAQLNFACDKIKGHKGHHIGTRIADNRFSWPQH